MLALLLPGLGCLHAPRTPAASSRHCVAFAGASPDGASALWETGAPGFVSGAQSVSAYHLHPGEGAAVQTLEAHACIREGLCAPDGTLLPDRLGLGSPETLSVAKTPVPGRVERTLPGVGPRSLALAERPGVGGAKELALVLEDDAAEQVLWRTPAALGATRAEWFATGDHLFVQVDAERGGVACVVGKADLRRAAARLLDAQAVALMREGEEPGARALLERAVELAPEDATAAYNLACVHALEGARDEALDWLGRALALDESRRLGGWARRDPDLASLRGTPTFEALTRP